MQGAEMSKTVRYSDLKQVRLQPVAERKGDQKKLNLDGKRLSITAEWSDLRQYIVKNYPRTIVHWFIWCYPSGEEKKGQPQQLSMTQHFITFKTTSEKKKYSTRNVLYSGAFVDVDRRPLYCKLSRM